MDALRNDIGGMPMQYDRLWRVQGKFFVAGFTEYNEEITGAAPILAKYMKYGDRLWPTVNRLRGMGWLVERVEDRK